MSEVDNVFVRQFNLAAQLGRDGEHAASLAAYRGILAKAAEGARATDEFCGTAWLRVGFCLMDLQRYEEAEAEFLAMTPLLAAMSNEARYEFHFAYANTLGNLGKMEAMFSEFLNAVCLSEDLHDFGVRPATCWANMLTHALNAEAWKFLETKAFLALNNARVRGIPALEVYAGEMLGKARRGLRKINWPCAARG